jgi:hypothetical protein
MLIYLFLKFKNPNLIFAGYKNITLHFEIILLISNNYLGKILKFSSFENKQKTEEKEYEKKKKKKKTSSGWTITLQILCYVF